MKQFEYRDYDHYVEAQTTANRKKIHEVWISEGNVRMIVAHFNLTPRSILCHGTRNATEQQLFRKYWSKAYIIGTEISELGTQFPMTVHHDMQFEKHEWERRFDIVYSNSFDHAISPHMCMHTWIEQLADGGRLYVDYADDPKVNYASETDPLALEPGDMEAIIEDAGGRLIAKLDGKSRKGHHTTIYVIGKR